MSCFVAWIRSNTLVVVMWSVALRVAQPRPLAFGVPSTVPYGTETTISLPARVPSPTPCSVVVHATAFAPCPTQMQQSRRGSSPDGQQLHATPSRQVTAQPSAEALTRWLREAYVESAQGDKGTALIAVDKLIKKRG